jgi:hypothetical protein
MKKKIVPALIPPTYEKLQNDLWLRDIWKFSLESIRQAKIIIFIGYSLPDTDGFLPAMIRASLSLRDRNQKLRIIIIDPSLDSFNRYKKLFGICDNEIQFHDLRFTEIVDNLDDIFKI